MHIYYICIYISYTYTYCIYMYIYTSQSSVAMTMGFGTRPLVEWHSVGAAHLSARLFGSR